MAQLAAARGRPEPDQALDPGAAATAAVESDARWRAKAVEDARQAMQGILSAKGFLA